MTKINKSVRGPELNTIFSQTLRTSPGYPGKSPGISRQKVRFPHVSKDIPNFLDPTPSRGRPSPNPKISGPRRFGFGFLLLPWSVGKSFRPECKCFRSVTFFITMVVQKAADVWKKNVWDLQAFSQTFFDRKFA